MWLAVTALACEDVTSGDVPTFAIVPDSVAGWVGDTVALRVTGDSATGVGGPSNLAWTVADTAVAQFIEAGDAGATLHVRGSGTTVVTARAGALAGEAHVTGIAEGDLLSSYSVGGTAWLQSPALDDHGNVYLFGVSVLLALDPGLSLRWERPVGASPLNPVVGEDGSLYWSAYRYTAGYSADGALLWRDTTHTGGETAPAVGPGGVVYAAGQPFSGSLDTWAVAAYDSSGIQVFRTAAFQNSIKVGLTIVADSVVVAADLAGRAFGLSLQGPSSGSTPSPHA